MTLFIFELSLSFFNGNLNFFHFSIRFDIPYSIIINNDTLHCKLPSANYLTLPQTCMNALNTSFNHFDTNVPHLLYVLTNIKSIVGCLIGTKQPHFRYVKNNCQ